jgi:type I restriction enzyme S subunit
MKSVRNWGRLGMKFNTMIMEDALDALIDYRGKTPKKSKTGIMTLSAKSVKNNHIDYSQCYFISEEEYEKFMVRGFPKKGDILLTTEAPLGLVARLDRNDVAIAQRLLTLRGKENVLDNDYLLYYLQSPIGQASLKARETGTTVTGIKQAEFRKIEIEIPDYEVQKKVSGILRVIDQKIEFNNAINNNLEQQAKALYKDWFFNFSPFSSDGNLPDDWRLGTVGDIIQLHDSKRVPLSGAERDKMAKVYPYYGATSLMDYVDNYLFDGIYILLGEDGTVVDSLGFPILQYVYGQFWVNNHAHIITGKEGFSVEELYLFFSLTNIKSIVTGAVQQKVSQQNLKKVPAIIPSKEALGAFDEITQPIFAQIRNLRDENANLSQLRDTLLPKLMSGELDVSDIEI